jgi:hypothetical protein
MILPLTVTYSSDPTLSPDPYLYPSTFTHLISYPSPSLLPLISPVSSFMLLLFTLLFSLGLRIHVSLAHAFLLSSRLFFVVAHVH